MMGRLCLRARFLAVVLVAFFTAATALFANAQSVSNTDSAPDQNAIRAIAATLAPVTDRADTVLESVKFAAVAGTIPGFAEWPALRKIETAYLSAVAAGGADGGEKFLRAVSQVVAENHSNAIRYERALKPYFSDASTASAVERSNIRYAPIPIAPPPPSNPATRKAILAIERYVDRVPGGMQSVMGACCGHVPDEVYDILRTSPSRTVALLHAIELGDLPPELRDRLLRLIKMIAESSHANPPSKWWTPLISSLWSRKVSDGNFASSIYG